MGPEIGEKHDFNANYPKDDPRKKWCRAYGRDRGETDVGTRSSPTTKEFADIGEEYNYLFDPTAGGWFVMIETQVKITQALHVVLTDAAKEGK